MAKEEEALPPIILAEPNTLLNFYGQFLQEGDTPITIVPDPQIPPLHRPIQKQPEYILADLSNENTRLAWLNRIYIMRQKWPYTPIGIMSRDSRAERAQAYSVGANLIYSTTTALEQVQYELQNLIIPTELSERKAQILMAYSVGKRQQDIADELFIVAETVKSHTTDLCQKFNAISRPMLVNAAFEQGFFPHETRLSEKESFPLSPKETESILAIGVSGSQKSAGELLGISSLTVKTHTQNIRKRTGWGVSESIANIWRYGEHNKYPDFKISKI